MWKHGTGCTLVAVFGLFTLACSEPPAGIRDDPSASSHPLFGESTPFNNAGQCLGDDAVTWYQLVSGLNETSSPSDLNCTSNDVEVTSVVATQMLVNGTWVNLGANNPISCTEGEVISIRATATLSDNASAGRSDVGLWIGTDGGDAQTGSCNHYNLPTDPLPSGVSDLDSDTCGDMLAGTTEVDLGELTLVCHAGESGGLEIPSCVAWSPYGTDRVCPVDSIAGANGFRAGTLPNTQVRCNCQPVAVTIPTDSVPTDTTGTLTIIKDAVPNDPQDFSFSTGGSGLTPFSLDDDADTTLANQRTFSGLIAGTYYVKENAAPGFDLTAITCSAGGVRGTADTVTITISPGANVTCTFTNTKRAIVQLNKRESNSLPLTRGWMFEVRDGASTSNAGTVVATGSANISTGVVAFACTSGTNPLCANVGGVARFKPVALQICERNMPGGWSNNISGFTPAGSPSEGTDSATECINVSLNAGAQGVPAGVPDPINNVPPSVSGGSITLQTGSFTLIGGQTSDALSGNFSIRNSSSGTQQVLVTSLSIIDATFKDGANLVQATVTGCVFSPLPVVIGASASQTFTVTGCQVTPSVRKELMFTIRAKISGGSQPFYDRVYKVRAQ